MYEEQFSKRLAELRTKKGVSARDMSLSIGQNPGYIRAIECGTTFPTMSNFFYKCTCYIYQNHRKKVISFSSCGCMIKYSTAFDFTV